jgi:hypothetical protein
LATVVKRSFRIKSELIRKRSGQALRQKWKA